VAKRIPSAATIQRRFRRFQAQRLNRLNAWAKEVNDQNAEREDDHPITDEALQAFREGTRRYGEEILARTEEAWWTSRRRYTLDDNWTVTPCASCGKPVSWNAPPVTCRECGA
jgi:hypothetical protein